MIDLAAIIRALALAVVLVGLGEILGRRLPVLRKFALPGAVIGGAIGFGLASAHLSLGSATLTALGEFPALFINVVFACLMLGNRVGNLSQVWKEARPHVVMGHTIAWGQYVVGLALTLALLAPLLGVHELAGPTIAIGFQGGHGTAAGLAENFQSLDFPEGKTIAYTIATIGIVIGAIGGPILANLLSRRTPVRPEEEDSDKSPDAAGRHDASEAMTGKLTIHLALLAIVITGAWLILQGLEWLERSLRGDGDSIYYSRYIPLFSVVLISGFGMQVLLQALGKDHLFDRRMFDKISGFSLDMVIVGALATLSLGVILEYWAAILVLAAGGLAWNLAVFFLLGPRLFPKPWHPYALGDLGGGTATTASGLLLIRVADPGQVTSARKSYSEKQPFYEPLMGGGLVTAMALPLVAMLGALPCLLITAAILAGWIAFGLIRVAKRGGDDQA